MPCTGFVKTRGTDGYSSFERAEHEDTCLTSPVNANRLGVFQKPGPPSRQFLEQSIQFSVLAFGLPWPARLLGAFCRDSGDRGAGERPQGSAGRGSACGAMTAGEEACQGEPQYRHRCRVLPRDRQPARCPGNARSDDPQASEAQREARTNRQRTAGKNQPPARAGTPEARPFHAPAPGQPQANQAGKLAGTSPGRSCGSGVAAGDGEKPRWRAKRVERQRAYQLRRALSRRRRGRVASMPVLPEGLAGCGGPPVDLG
jgi:hypothetical protein